MQREVSMENKHLQEALQLISESDLALDRGDHAAAKRAISRAIELTERSDDPGSDRTPLLASSKARLSCALEALSDHEGCIEAADEAMALWEMLGGEYPAERKWQFLARFNRGTSLFQLGRFSEAIEALQGAGHFTKRYGGPPLALERTEHLLVRAWEELRRVGGG